jgi:uncharacterized protein
MHVYVYQISAKIKPTFRRSLAWVLAAFFLYACGSQEAYQRVVLANRVLDSANVLLQTEREQIFDLILDLDTTIGAQVALITVNSLKGETIENFALKKFEDLKLGRKNEKDGLLIIVAVNDKKIRIEVGYGLEHIVKDEIAARIIRDDMAPQFQKDNFFEGIYIAVQKIKDLVAKNKELVGKMPARY